MKITIDIGLLLNIMDFVVMLTLAIITMVRQEKQRKQRRDIAERWMKLHPQYRAGERWHRLFHQPLEDHQIAHPDDVKAMVVMVRSRDASMVQLWHHDMNNQSTKWTEGHGLELMKDMLVDIRSLEQQIPGLIAPLTVMLDEERSKIEKARNEQAMQ